MAESKDNGWDGIQERREELPLVCRRNCMEHSGIETKINNIDAKLTVVLGEHASAQRLGERVSMLMWLLGGSLMILVVGAIYVFTTNSNFHIQYAQDQTKMVEQISKLQQETIDAIHASSDSNREEIQELKEINTRDLTIIKESFDETTRELRKRLTVVETIQRVQEKQGREIQAIKEKVEIDGTTPAQ